MNYSALIKRARTNAELEKIKPGRGINWLRVAVALGEDDYATTQLVEANGGPYKLGEPDWTPADPFIEALQEIEKADDEHQKFLAEVAEAEAAEAEAEQEAKTLREEEMIQMQKKRSKYASTFREYPDGKEVLKDLKDEFYDSDMTPSGNVSLERLAGQRDVILYILRLLEEI